MCCAESFTIIFIHGMLYPPAVVMTGTVEEKSLATDGGGTWVLSREPQQIRVLTLNDGEHLESTLFRLQKGKVIGNEHKAQSTNSP